MPQPCAVCATRHEAPTWDTSCVYNILTWGSTLHSQHMWRWRGKWVRRVLAVLGARRSAAAMRARQRPVAPQPAACGVVPVDSLPYARLRACRAWALRLCRCARPVRHRATTRHTPYAEAGRGIAACMPRIPPPSLSLPPPSPPSPSLQIDHAELRPLMVGGRPAGQQVRLMEDSVVFDLCRVPRPWHGTVAQVVCSRSRASIERSSTQKKFYAHMHMHTTYAYMHTCVYPVAEV
jgi:hypothetical protein